MFTSDNESITIEQKTYYNSNSHKYISTSFCKTSRNKKTSNTKTMFTPFPLSSSVEVPKQKCNTCRQKCPLIFEKISHIDNRKTSITNSIQANILIAKALESQEYYDITDVSDFELDNTIDNSE